MKNIIIISLIVPACITSIWLTPVKSQTATYPINKVELQNNLARAKQMLTSQQASPPGSNTLSPEMQYLLISINELTLSQPQQKIQVSSHYQLQNSFQPKEKIPAIEHDKRISAHFQQAK